MFVRGGRASQWVPNETFGRRRGLKLKKKSQKSSPGQLNLWEQWDAQIDAAHVITEKFLRANSYNPEYALSQIPNPSRYKVSDFSNADSS